MLSQSKPKRSLSYNDIKKKRLQRQKKIKKKNINSSQKLLAQFPSSTIQTQRYRPQHIASIKTIILDQCQSRLSSKMYSSKINDLVEIIRKQKNLTTQRKNKDRYSTINQGGLYSAKQRLNFQQMSQMKVLALEQNQNSQLDIKDHVRNLFQCSKSSKRVLRLADVRNKLKISRSNDKLSINSSRSLQLRKLQGTPRKIASQEKDMICSLTKSKSRIKKFVPVKQDEFQGNQAQKQKAKSSMICEKQSTHLKLKKDSESMLLNVNKFPSEQSKRMYNIQSSHKSQFQRHKNDKNIQNYTKQNYNHQQNLQIHQMSSIYEKQQIMESKNSLNSNSINQLINCLEENKNKEEKIVNLSTSKILQLAEMGTQDLKRAMKNKEKMKKFETDRFRRMFPMDFFKK